MIKERSLKPKVFLLIFLLSLLSCTASHVVDPSRVDPKINYYWWSDREVSPRYWFLYKYGLPRQAGGELVFDLEDLFHRDRSPQRECWRWRDGEEVVFLSPPVMASYVPPRLPPGELSIRVLDTCSIDGEFCVEILLDGLTVLGGKTLCRIEAFRRDGRRWIYIFDSSPVVGTTGLRAMWLALFLEKNKFRKDSILIFAVTDFVTGQKRETVLKI